MNFVHSLLYAAAFVICAITIYLLREVNAYTQHELGKLAMEEARLFGGVARETGITLWISC